MNIEDYTVFLNIFSNIILFSMNYMIIERDKLNLKKLQPMKMKRITVFFIRLLNIYLI